MTHKAHRITKDGRLAHNDNYWFLFCIIVTLLCPYIAIAIAIATCIDVAIANVMAISMCVTISIAIAISK